MRQYFWDAEYRIVFMGPQLPSEGEKVIARKAISRVIAYIGPDKRQLFGPGGRQYMIHRQLPEREDNLDLALSREEFDAGDPKNKLHVAVDRLIADLPPRVTSFYEPQLPHGLDSAFLVLHVDTNLCLRILRAFDIEQNIFAMAVSVVAA